MKFDSNTDYYAVLGVSKNADALQIQKAYKALVAKYHPDKHQGNELEDLAKEKLTEANEAYNILSNQSLKIQYDGARKHRVHIPPSTGGNNCAPQGPAPKDAATIVRKLIIFILFAASVPFALRFVRSPKIAAVIGIAVLLAWFGPRIVKFFRRK